MALTFMVLIPILVVVVIGGIIVLLVRGKTEGGIDFSFHTVVSAYLALMMGASLTVAAAGGARLVSAVLSDAFGRSFSYQTYSFGPDIRPVTPPGAPDTSPSAEEQRERVNESERARIENQYRDDIVYGVTMLVVGLLVFGVHLVGRQFLRRRAAEPVLISRSYTLLMLVTTSVVGLVSLVVAIAGIVRRFLIQTVGADQAIASPGGSVALAIAFLPLWVWFLFRALRAVTSSNQSEAN